MSANPRHDRYWPRDAPVRWSALARRLTLWLVILASALAHFGLAALYVAFIAAGSTSAIVAWVLALAWIGLAGFLVWNWLFFRWRIVLAPIGGAVLLWLVSAGRI
jgi:hypothetical protein